MNSRNYQISWELTIAKASYCRSPWSVISRYFLAKKNTIPSSGESRYSVPSNLIKVNQMGQSSKSTCTKCEWIPQHGNLKANWLLPRFMLPKCGGHVGVAQGPKGSEISKTSPTPVELQILKKKLQKYIFFFTHDYIYIMFWCSIQSTFPSLAFVFHMFSLPTIQFSRDWPWRALQLWCCTGFLNITVTDETIGPLDHQWLLQINHHFEWCFTFLKWRHTLLLKTTHIT